MNLGLRQIFTVLATLLFAINVPAQDIPLMPADPAVLKGVTPNGMAYYLVSNPDKKGVADFALVQKTGLLNSTEDGAKVLEAADGAAASLRRVKREIKSGNIKVTDDATVFRFENIRLEAHVLDSTLIMLTDIADRANYIDDEFIQKWYAPADQAIIISGDINAKEVASKLTYMSYMVPSRMQQPRREYVHEEGRSSIDVREKGEFAEVSVTWTSQRVPREYMNTVQPEIFEMSLNTLGAAAAGRIRTCLRNMDVPVADVSYSHVCSSTYPYDDSFALHVAVKKENADNARDAIAAVMSSIDRQGVMTNEYLTAESSYIQELVNDAHKPERSNREYVDRCRNAFLYNASLASSKERLAFHTSRNLPDTMRQRLFNGIASAVIDMDGIPVPENIRGNYVDFTMPDTLGKPVPPLKIKMKSSKKEPVSGGEIWTFSNGFKVVYKKMASDRMYYSFALNGGYGSVEGLSAGEGAYMADYLKMCRVGHVRTEDLMKRLSADGVDMDIDVNFSNMMISGSLPDDRLSLLLRSLLAVANERTPGDAGDFDYYRRSEYLALDYTCGSFASRIAAVDSIMCPGYNYSPYKSKDKISDGFTIRADKYFEDRFAKTNDGMLVLVGGMDEDAVKKTLLSYVGHFRTSNVAPRKQIERYQPVSGTLTHMVVGDSDNVDVAVSARMPLTMDNYVAAGLALMSMSNDLNRIFNESGIDVKFSQVFRIYPEERLNVMISIPSAGVMTFSDVRAALAEMKSMEITDKELDLCKAALKNSMALDMKTQAYWVHAIVLRYLDGKDLTTNYAARIDAVTLEKVRGVLAQLADGTKVEYVTKKK